MPFFLLKNSLGAKMKKGIKTFCNNNGSTSTLNQQNSHNNNSDFTSKVSSSNSPTLEDLILQLELEEEMARKAKLNNISEYSGIMRGRMSCVNNSDILRSARNALNQYPRFSLDGRDAMYRSSFGNIEGRRSVCSEISLGGKKENDLDNNNNHKGMCFLPPTLAGESVVWQKPGVVAKLMGLEAMPVPIGSSSRISCENNNKEKLSAVVRRQNLIRRRVERHDLERKLLTMEMQHQGCGYNNNNNNNNRRHTNNNNGCSNNGYCIMKPVCSRGSGRGPG
ncbi:hypothetical protein HKD37_13G037106 [Glycine soja]